MWKEEEEEEGRGLFIPSGGHGVRRGHVEQILIAKANHKA